jgi:3' terminal RNA ribose 2'-O-methyltransferase Hen1
VFLTITSTAPDATGLGHLLHKHPERVQRFDVSVGAAMVFYPEATDERCTVALMVDVDPIGLVRRGRSGGEPFALAHYVNDRPYAASSMLAVAIGQVFRTALRGECASRPELAASALPLKVHVPSAPCRGDADLVARLFEPLGWAVDAVSLPLDPALPHFGDSRYVDLTLTGNVRLADALAHLYVLLPVLDGSKHYWVGDDEVDKVVRRGGAWLQGHPERDFVLRRYLAHRRSLVADATERLAALDDSLAFDATPSALPDVDSIDSDSAGNSFSAGIVELPPVRLAEHRIAAVLAALQEIKAAHVVDLGCGSGSLLARLLGDAAYARVVGVDVSARELAWAARRLHVDRMSERQASRLSLLLGSVTYRDSRIVGADAIVLMEVIEHLDPDRLPSLERSVFGHARPGAVIVTTPNSEFNVRYPNLAAGALRHPDHRFEWTHAEFGAWASRVATAYGYAVSFRPVGDVDPDLGPSTQLALFTRGDTVARNRAAEVTG